MQSHKPQVVVEFSKLIINETKFNKYAKTEVRVFSQIIFDKILRWFFDVLFV